MVVGLGARVSTDRPAFRPRPRHLGRVLLLRDGVAISRLLPVLALPRLLARLARVKNRSGTNFRRDTRRRRRLGTGLVTNQPAGTCTVLLSVFVFPASSASVSWSFAAPAATPRPRPTLSVCVPAVSRPVALPSTFVPRTSFAVAVSGSPARTESTTEREPFAALAAFAETSVAETEVSLLAAAVVTPWTPLR